MKKILFVTIDSFSNINPSVEKQLRNNFPEYEIEVLKLRSKLAKNIIVLIQGAIATAYEYAFDFILGRKNILSLKKYLYHTPFMIRYFNGEVSKKIAKNDYAFVFQTQAFCDSSSSNTPNFIYSDHTNLNNLNYPSINPKQYLASSRFVKLEKEIYNKATALFVMSSNIKESLVQQYQVNPAKVKLVYAGSNTKITGESNAAKYANKSILFVGKHWDRKGGPILIEAFKLVLEKIPDATLTIIGCSPKLNIKNCSVLGKVPLDQVSEHYNNTSVFCLPTKREPFGIVFIEAMLNRLPVITNSMGAATELVVDDKNGYLLNNDYNQYAEKLIFLLNNPAKCEEFGNYSFQLAHEKYTWDNTGKLISKNIKEHL